MREWEQVQLLRRLSRGESALVTWDGADGRTRAAEIPTAPEEEAVVLEHAHLQTMVDAGWVAESPFRPTRKEARTEVTCWMVTPRGRIRLQEEYGMKL